MDNVPKVSYCTTYSFIRLCLCPYVAGSYRVWYIESLKLTRESHLYETINSQIKNSFYFLIHVVWESIVIVKKLYFEILMDLHVFSTPEYGRVGFGMLPLCMYVHRASAWTVE
jgi:hypothetical protein